MPALELVCCMGAGYEMVDLDAARARGIALANGQGTNDDCVADHAFGLLIASVRGFHALDRLCREGVWRNAIPQPPNVSGKRLGILGLGTIGQKIARRAAGFDMTIGYHNRQPKEGVPHRYFDSLKALAEWSDFLVCAAPGGAATRHIVNAEVLDALGPKGFLVNIGRGSGAQGRPHRRRRARRLRERAEAPRRTGRAGQPDHHAAPGRLVAGSDRGLVRALPGQCRRALRRPRRGLADLSACPGDLLMLKEHNAGPWKPSGWKTSSAWLKPAASAAPRNCGM